MHLPNILSNLQSAIYFIGILSVLVIVHEWGHFIAARICKMPVTDFSLFFGPRIWRIGKFRGTEYNIRSIPTLALFKNGREIARQAGVMDVAGIVSWAKSKI